MENKLELWLYNTSKMDVIIGDLGVKVPVGKTVNVYSKNPHLTELRVGESLKTGSLFKRLSGLKPVLKIVNKQEGAKPAVNRLKQSTDPIKIRRTKSSVILEDTTIVDENNSFGFADYGVDNLGAADRVRENASVVVKVKEDEPPNPKSGVKTAPKTDSAVSDQSAVVMDTMSKGLTNPIGPIADDAAKGKKAYVVTKAPLSIQEKVEPPTVKTKVTKGKETITVNVSKAGSKKGNKVTRAGESDPVALEKTDFDVKVATKKSENSVVMELKEVPKETKPKTKK